MKINQKFWQELWTTKSPVGLEKLCLGKIFKNGFPLVSFTLGLFAVFVSWYEPVLKNVMPGNLVDILPLISLLLALILMDKTRIRLYKFHFWAIGFIFVVIVSSLWAVFIGNAQLNAIMYLVLISHFYIAFFWSQGQKTAFIVRGLTIIGIPMALYGIWQFVVGTGSFHTSYLETASTRSSSFFGSPNVFGFIVAILTIISVFEYFRKKDMLFLGTSFVYLFSTIFSFSRTAWLALIFGLIYLFLSNLRQFTGLFAGAFLPSLKSRLGTIFSPNYWFDASIDGRLWTIKNGWYIFRQHPLLGTGAGTYGSDLAVKYTSPVYFQGMQQGYVPLYATDNQYIALLVQFGILGFLCFLFSGFLYWVETYNFQSYYQKLARIILFMFVIVMLTANSLEFLAVAMPIAILLGGICGDNYSSTSKSI